MAGAGDGEGQSLCLGTAVAFWSGKTAVFWPLSGTSIIKKKIKILFSAMTMYVYWLPA